MSEATSVRACTLALCGHNCKCAGRNRTHPTVTATLCGFDSGPLHEGELAVKHVDGELPPILVTDEGDYWVTYVLLNEGLRDRPTYSYAGAATESERRRCPRVP